MKLSPIFSQRLEEATQLGIQQGVKQARREMIESFFRLKLGKLDDQLETIIIPMIDLPAPDLAKLILELSDLSTVELLAKLTSEN